MNSFIPIKIKYPRTPHLPWSLGISSDDQTIEVLESFQRQEIVCSEKRDGECTSLYSDGSIHARSVNSTSQPWQSWVRRFWQDRCFDLPQGWRLCGENLYAKHSIAYRLDSYFEGFSIWNSDNICLSWQETTKWFQLLGIKPVPVLHEGSFDEGLLRQIANQLDTSQVEGYVIRLAGEISYENFGMSVAKFVRKNHVQTDQHWSKTWKPNLICP